MFTERSGPTWNRATLSGSRRLAVARPPHLASLEAGELTQPEAERRPGASCFQELPAPGPACIERRGFRWQAQ